MNGDQPQGDDLSQGDSDAPTVPSVPALDSEQAQNQDSSDDAKREASALAQGTLEDEAAKAEHGRNENLRDAIHSWALRLVVLVAGIFAITVIILAWHFLAPDKWSWLTKEQLGTIKTIVFSGALSSAAGGYLNRRIR